MTIRAIFQSKTFSLFNCSTRRISRDDVYDELGSKGPAHFNIHPLLLRQGLVLVHKYSFGHGW